MSDTLPPRALDPAKPAPKPRPNPHDRRMTRLPENTLGRYRTTAELVRRIAADHAAKCVAAAKSGHEAPELDKEIVADVCEFSIRGRIG